MIRILSITSRQGSAPSALGEEEDDRPCGLWNHPQEPYQVDLWGKSAWQTCNSPRPSGEHFESQTPGRVCARIHSFQVTRSKLKVSTRPETCMLKCSTDLCVCVCVRVCVSRRSPGCEIETILWRTIPFGATGVWLCFFKSFQRALNSAKVQSNHNNASERTRSITSFLWNDSNGQRHMDETLHKIIEIVHLESFMKND